MRSAQTFSGRFVVSEAGVHRSPSPQAVHRFRSEQGELSRVPIPMLGVGYSLRARGLKRGGLS